MKVRSILCPTDFSELKAIERMFFGSTALHVLQQAGCPVLTVRPSFERRKP